MIDKILSLVTVGSTLANVGVLHRFLLTMTAVLMLALLSGFTFCILLVFAFYAIYLCLIQYGIAAHVAGIIMALAALIISILFGATAFYKIGD